MPMPARRSSPSRKLRRTKQQNGRPGEREPNLREVRIFRAKPSSHRSQATVAAELEVLEEILGHHFQNRELLERALTHKSRVDEENTEAPSDNEQLEFHRDPILGV